VLFSNEDVARVINRSFEAAWESVRPVPLVQINFGDGNVNDNDLASGLQGAVIKDDDKDVVVWKDYLANVMKKRGASWRGLYAACQQHVGE